MDERLARDVRRLAALSVIGYVALVAMSFYWGFLRSADLAARPDNPRRILEERRVQRGRILDMQGQVLAFSEAPEAGAGGAPRRVYPHPAAAPVVGFQTWRYGAGLDPAVTYGTGGAEAAYDVALRGDLGRSVSQQLASRVLKRPRAGRDVVLTLDVDLQNLASELLAGRSGAVVVLDVRSGAVRALASQPTFDPMALDAVAAGQAPPDQIMWNRATQGLYPPGSTWKMVTFAAALDQGLVAPGDVVDDGARVAYFDGFPVRCDNNPPGTDRFDMRHAFAYSCNVTFARLGEELGETRFRRYARAFGLGEAPPFPLPVAAGSLTDSNRMPLPELVSAAFGQGKVLVTPLHMALVAAAIARDGTVPVPVLLADVPGVRWAGIADERGTWRRAVTSATAAAVREAMVVTAEEGWGQAARRAGGVSMGVKTGTAETGRGSPHAWTVGFAPADAPRVAAAVVVEAGGSGAETAAPITGRVLARALELDESAGASGR